MKQAKAFINVTKKNKIVCLRDIKGTKKISVVCIIEVFNENLFFEEKFKRKYCSQ